MKKIIRKRIDRHYSPANKRAKFNVIADGLLAIAIMTLILANVYLSASNSGTVLGEQNDPNGVETPDDRQNNTTSTDDVVTPTSTDQVTSTSTPPKPVVIEVTDIDFQSFARYYTIEGEQLGIGPNPPVVGMTTKYWVFLSLKDFDHDLENVVLTANISDEVLFTGKSSVTHGDNISIDNELKTITWTLGDLPAQTDLETIGAALEMEITPIADQIGQSAVLISSISLYADDKIAKKPITKFGAVITTNLTADKLSDNNGVILAN
jgi:hypothetical protein